MYIFTRERDLKGHPLIPRNSNERNCYSVRVVCIPRLFSTNIDRSIHPPAVSCRHLTEWVNLCKHNLLHRHLHWNDTTVVIEAFDKGLLLFANPASVTFFTACLQFDFFLTTPPRPSSGGRTIDGSLLLLLHPHLLRRRQQKLHNVIWIFFRTMAHWGSSPVRFCLWEMW